MGHFEIQTDHIGLIKIFPGGPAFAIPEHRLRGVSEQSQIAVAKLIKGEPALLLQTHDKISGHLEAALEQALETCIYFASEMPLTGEGTALSIWGITLITFIEATS